MLPSFIIILSLSKLFHSILTQKNNFHAGTENATSASSVSKHSILLRADKESKCGDKHSCGQKWWRLSSVGSKREK